MGWLAENREEMKSEIKGVRTWDKKQSQWCTVLHEFRITIRPKDTADVQSAQTLLVSIDQIEGNDADSYECPRNQVLGN